MSRVVVAAVARLACLAVFAAVLFGAAVAVDSEPADAYNAGICSSMRISLRPGQTGVVNVVAAGCLTSADIPNTQFRCWTANSANQPVLVADYLVPNRVQSIVGSGNNNGRCDYTVTAAPDAQVGQAPTYTRVVVGYSNLSYGGIIVTILADSLTHYSALDAAGCTDGTFVDTTANPRVAGENNDLVEDCQALVAIQNEQIALARANQMTLSNNALASQWGISPKTKVADWTGITVRDGRVVEVDLRRGSLARGSAIPQDLRRLTGIGGTGVSGNAITGDTGIKLDYNALVGPIPAWFADFTGMTDLWLRNNQLSGPIPAGLGQLTALTTLTLTNNQLTGPIPAGLGNLTALTVLWMRNNQLTGPIPAGLGNLTALTSLSLAGNQLTGPIPAGLGNLTALTLLNLANNQLSGPIPAGLGQLTALTELKLTDNQLTGPIPAELGNLTALTILTLADNRLSGEIPDALSSLTSLASFTVCNNYFWGDVPTGVRSLITDATEFEPIGCQPESNVVTSLPPGAAVIHLPAAQARGTAQFDASDYIKDGEYLISCSDAVIAGETINSAQRDGCVFTLSMNYSYGTSTLTIDFTTIAGGSGTATFAIVSSDLTIPTVTPPPPARTPDTGAGSDDTRPGDEQPSRIIWHTYTLRQGQTTPTDIQNALNTPPGSPIFVWKPARQSTPNPQPAAWANAPDIITAGTTIAFRAPDNITQENLDALNLGSDTLKTLTAGWNPLNPPNITKPQNFLSHLQLPNITNPPVENFLFHPQLTNCDNPTILAVTTWNPDTNTWALWLPCHPQIQTALTNNSPFQPLTNIATKNTTYINTTTPTNIIWNPTTQTYQPTILAQPPSR